MLLSVMRIFSKDDSKTLGTACIDNMESNKLLNAELSPFSRHRFYYTEHNIQHSHIAYAYTFSFNSKM